MDQDYEELRGMLLAKREELSARLARLKDNLTSGRSADSQEQAQVFIVHVRRHRDYHAVAVTGHLVPNLLQLPTNQIGGTQVLKALIRQWVRSQVRPEVVMNTTRLDACIRKSRVAGCQPIIFEQCESRLTIEHRILVEDRNSSVVNVSRE